MDAQGDRDELRRQFQEWQKQAAQAPERAATFSTLSNIPVEPLYTEASLAANGHDDLRDVGLSGQYPYTRGINPTGYRSRLWTIRMFAGFGTAEQSNMRYKYLLAHGETGLSVAFDLPTLMGYDTDDEQAIGEFGKGGVGVSSVADMELLFDGIAVDQITTSMTINGPAAIVWAMFIAAAAKRGIPMKRLGGTLQNDILKEFIAQNEYIFPPNPSVKLVVDTVEFGAQQMPRWSPISISGYHIREAGATAVQELAFTLADGFAYVEACLERGLPIDKFAPRLSFFFNCHNDFFEEIAKFRAARRIWARAMREQYGAQNELSWWMRFHTQTAGVSLTAQQPYNNVVRVAIQALAAILGGTQSLHTNGMDEALALPSERAAHIALRTQQIIAHETGVTNTVDPLGGSFFAEALTDRMEAEARSYFEAINRLGGVVPALEQGFFQREIADSAYRYQKEVEERSRIIVGVNDFLDETEEAPVPLLGLELEVGSQRHLERLNTVRRQRDTRAVLEQLRNLRIAARKNKNLMPHLLDAVSEYATLGEVCGVLREVYGEYHGSWVV